MRRTMIVSSVLWLWAGSAMAAGDDVMAGYFGNTVISSGGIIEGHMHYKADHSFDVTFSAMGMSHNFSGTWNINGQGQLCRTYVGGAPPDSPNSVCGPIAARKVGDSWTVTTNGETRARSLVAGIR